MKPADASPSRCLAPSLLATTSLAALLLGAAPARAGGLSFDGQTQASVTNPANTTLTSIVINNSTVTGAVTNAGTISPGKAGAGFNGATVALAVSNNSTIGGGIHNTGTINVSGSGFNVAGIFIIDVNGMVNTIAGGISNTGTISASGAHFSKGLHIGSTTLVTGDITNTGMISAGGTSVAISGNSVNSLTTITGRIVNTGTISSSSIGFGEAFDLTLTTVSGGILNAGAISRASGAAGGTADGVVTIDGGVSGGFTNTGTISALATGTGAGVIFSGTTVAGGVTNTGMISASGTLGAVGLSISDRNSNPILFPTGNIFTNGIISGGVTNSGTIAAVSSAGRAIGVEIGRVFSSGVAPVGGTISGGITNTGTIRATGKTGTGILITSGGTIAGGIANTGTIAGNTAAIDLSGEGGPTVINQAGGALIGDVKLSANADVLNFTGGTIFNTVTAPAGNQGVVAISGMAASFAPMASVSGVSALTIAPGSRLTLQVTPTQAPSIHAGTIALAGTLNVAPQGSLFGFAATHTYTNVFVADPPLSGSFANVTTTAGSLFQASVSPDPTTANALDLTLALSQTGLAASAQDLTQSLRLGLDAPRVLTQAVQDRLVANGGALGEWAPGGAASAAAKGAAGFSFCNANVWARGADQFGSATAPTSSAGVGYDINRAAPLIAGVDWRLDNGIVAGVAATYVATSASFKDGSRTNVSSYQGAAYAGWAGGLWYALGSVVASFNDFVLDHIRAAVLRDSGRSRS